MKFLTRIAVLFYVTLIMFLSSFLLLFVLNYIDVQNIVNLFTLMYYDEALRMAFAVGACALLFLNFVSPNLISIVYFYKNLILLLLDIHANQEAFFLFLGLLYNNNF